MQISYAIFHRLPEWASRHVLLFLKIDFKILMLRLEIIKMPKWFEGNALCEYEERKRDGELLSIQARGQFTSNLIYLISLQ